MNFLYAKAIHISILIFLLLGGFSASARINLFINNSPANFSLIPVESFEDTSRNFQLERFNSISGFLKLTTEENLNISYKNKMYWLRIDVSQIPINDSVFYLEIRNPHINFLGAWLMDGDKIISAYPLTGDRLPFSSRNVIAPDFVYKLKASSKKNLRLILMVDKRNEQLSLPLNFVTESQLMANNRNRNLIAGLLTGIGIFILLFTMFLYFNIHERLYVYYGIYIMLVAGYIASDFGLSFMFLYPNHQQLNDLSRPFCISLTPVFYILFSRKLLNVKNNFPQLHKISSYFIALFPVCLMLGLLIVPDTGTLRAFLLVLMQVLLVGSIVLVLIYSIASWHRQVKYAAYIVFITTLFTVFTQIYVQFMSGYLPDNTFTRNSMYIGFSLELFVLTLALSLRFTNYKRDAEELLKRLTIQQEQVFKSVSQYQENEMNRVSGILHDSIGAGLSSIKYNLEAFDKNDEKGNAILKHTIDDVSALTDEVRNLSHNISPILLQKKGLISALKELIEKYNRTGSIAIQLESIGSSNSASFPNELLVYRIVQELLQNAIKHAAASEVIIQLMIEPELISIYVEDDGKGFEQNLVKEGLGFSQIRELVRFVSGRFNLVSSKNRGCQVSIEFPIIPYESSDKSISGGRSPYVFRRG